MTPSTPASSTGGSLRYALPALPLLAVALGGGTDRGGQAAVLLALGGLLLWRPPTVSHGRGLGAVAWMLIALAVAPLALPARWFPGASWRTVLSDDLSIPLGNVLSPQPALTAEGVVMLLAGLGWLWWTMDLAGAMPGRERRALARPFVLGAVALALVSAICYRRGIVPPGWHPHRGFGPFPNRNQTANFLALSGLLAIACAHADLRAGGRGRLWRAVGWLVCLAILADAIFLNYSRAGVLMLLGGAGVYGLAVVALGARRWGAPPGNHHRRTAVGVVVSLAARLALPVSALALLLAGFLVFGGTTLERFLPPEAATTAGGAGEGMVNAVTGDFRWRVQADAFHLARAAPWCGLGLGNFGAVFPFFREQSATTSSRAVHPESDWLWLWTEMGWLGVALSAAGAALLLAKLRAGRRPEAAVSPEEGERTLLRPVRLAAIVALGAFLVHSFIEVSAHRFGTALCAIFFYGLALPSTPKLPPPRAAAAWTVAGRGAAWRLLGAGFLVVGALWLAAARTGGVWPPGTLAAANLEKAGAARVKAGDLPGAVDRLTEAIASTPLSWRLYLTRGLAEVRRGQTEAAELDFRRARELEPLFPGVPERELGAWLAEGQHLDLALAALEETFRRDPARGERAFRNAVQRAGGNLPLRRGLDILAWREPALWLALIDELAPADARPRIAALVAEDPGLTRFADNPARLRRALRLWAARGDAAALVAAMEARPGWKSLAWPAWAEALAVTGSHELACAVAARAVEPPTLPASLSAPVDPRSAEVAAQTLADAFARDPGNLALGLRLFNAQRAAGRESDALATVALLGARPNAPPYLAYVEATRRAEVGDWPRAWEAWQRYLHSKPES